MSDVAQIVPLCHVEDEEGNRVVGIGKDFFDKANTTHYGLDWSASRRNHHSYFNSAVTDAGGNRLHGGNHDIGVDREGTENNLAFFFDKKDGLLGDPFTLHMRYHAGIAVRKLHDDEQDPEEKEKWLLDGNRPQCLDDVKNSLHGSSFSYLIKNDPSKAIAYVWQYVHYLAKTNCHNA